MEREKFEESWKDAFSKAEMEPSDQVWTNIELDLERHRGGELKRRIFFYQMLAAASVAFALAVAGVGYYQMTEFKRGDQLAVRTPAHAAEQSESEENSLRIAPESSTADLQSFAQQPNINSERTGSEPSASSLVNPDLAIASSDKSSVSSVRPRTSSELGLRASDDTGRLTRSESTYASEGKGTNDAAHSKTSIAFANLPTELDDERLPRLTIPDRRPELVIAKPKEEENVVDPVMAMLARLEQRARDLGEESRERESGSHEQLWTSIGLAAGSFNTVHASTANMRAMSASAQSVAAPIVDNEAKASGMSYSMGVNVGTRIANRWVLQGGVNYLTQASEYTTDNVVMTSTGYSSRFMAAHSNALVGARESELHQKIVYSAPYTVNNSMRYLSIPMQAGYLVVDKAFGVQVNAGLATDLFLQNTVKGDGDQLARTSQAAGEDSPYRAVNLSGLFGTELSYRFSDHYRVALNPGIRYPFNTIYKSELGIQSTPLTFDIGLRFRYIFH